MEQSNEEIPKDANAIKKEDLLRAITASKNIVPFWRRTPASIREAESMLKKIKGDFVYPEDQFKLYKGIAKAKSKTPLMEFFEKDILGFLAANIPAKKGTLYFFTDARSLYFENLNALLKYEVIPDAATFRQILEKDPKEINSAINGLIEDPSFNAKEMLAWLVQLEKPGYVDSTITKLQNGPNAQLYKDSPLKGKFVQILSKEGLSDYADTLTEIQISALKALANSYRPLSDLSPEFVEEVLAQGSPLDFIAQHYFENPDRIAKIYAALPEEHWTKDNIRGFLSRNDGILLSEEAEKRLWSNIPAGLCKDDVYSTFTSMDMESPESYFRILEYAVKTISENKINFEISAEIKKYESKRWPWERWFFKLPEPIRKAKEILNSGTGDYKNLNGKQLFELLQCLNEASKKDKRTTEILGVLEGVIRFKYQLNSQYYDDIETILSMVKEGIIDTPQKFEVATQKAQHWVSECYKNFIVSNTDKATQDLAWSLIFTHDEPEKFAEAVSILAQRNFLNYENLTSIQLSNEPSLFLKASIVLHDKAQTEQNSPTLELLTDEDLARKVLKISELLENRKDSNSLFEYLMKLEDSKIEKIKNNQSKLDFIDKIIKRKVLKEIPPDLFGQSGITVENIINKIGRDSSQFSEIRKACNFELTDKDFKDLFKGTAILLGEKAINEFWKNIPEGACDEKNFNYILSITEIQDWGERHIMSQTKRNTIVFESLEENLSKLQTKQAQQERGTGVETQPTSSPTKEGSPRHAWVSAKAQGEKQANPAKDKEEAQKEEKRPPSKPAGKNI